MSDKEKVLKLMQGAYDIHMHAKPALYKVGCSILEVAKEGREYGMKGLVYKDFHFSTAPQAQIVMEAVPGIDIIGGVSLSGTLGGLNPWAVEATLKLGGKVVWMFTLDSEFTVQAALAPGFPYPKSHYRNMLVDLDAGGYSVFTKGTEELKDEAREIISLLKQYDGVLETSHLSPKEAFAMIREGKAQGLRKMAATHCNQWATPYTIEQQKEFIELGAIVSYCAEAHFPKPGVDPDSYSAVAKLIRAVGVDNIALGSDLGSDEWPSGVEGIKQMIGGLLDEGFSDDEISKLVSKNPDRIYGLR